MSNIVPFDYHGQQVRVTGTKENPLWVLADVCKVLDISNPRNVSARLEDDEKGVRQIDTLGGKQKVSVVTESGLYAVILRSDKPEAKPFRKWITSEVLPSIRKTGSYSVNAYHPKSTSLGEVASFIKVMRSVMKENSQSPEKIAEMAETVCKQFHVDVPENFVVHNPFQQTNLFSITFNNNILPQKI